MEYVTPDSFWKPLDNEFHFTMDAAATKKNAKCAKYMTRRQDSLKTPWGNPGEICWLNPPFRNYRVWFEKCAEEQKRGITTVVLALSRITSAGWFHETVIPNAEIRFVRGCLKFGNFKTALPLPLILCIFRGKKVKMAA
jgi:phage N-6-adenine-methyltransferase